MSRSAHATTRSTEGVPGRALRHAACAALLTLPVLALPLPAAAGFLDLDWTAPTTNTDGSPLLDLAGYRVYSGTSSPACPGPGFQTLTASDPSPAPGSLVAATLTGLTTGTTYWIRVSAVDTAGNEGPCTAAVSAVAHTNIDATPATLGFGNVDIGASATLDFIVDNLGSSALTGTASTAAPFSIVSGGKLNVAPGATQVVRVAFTPLAGQVFAGSVTFTSSIDTLTRPVTGTGVVTTPAVLQFSQASPSVTEGGTAMITVTRTGGTIHGGVTVDYATSDGTASSGDYTSTSGTLSFQPGVTSRTFTVATTQDSVVEPAETVTLTLSNPQGGATLGTTNPATLSITNDDVGGTLQFSPATYAVAEGGGTVTLTVTRTGGSASGVTVAYATANGTATAGADYSSRSGTLTFTGGTTSRTISVPILQDRNPETAETFTVTLTNPQGGATLGAAAVATITITDDEPPPAVLKLSQAAYSVAEGGTVTITVTRTGGTHGGVTVGYATGHGTATSGDYTGATGTLTFGAGVMSRTFTVTTTQDLLVEGAHALTLTLSNPQGVAVLGTPSTATVTITDDEPTLRFSAATYTVAETAGQAMVTVTRAGSTAGVLTVGYATTTGGTAAVGTDYTPVTGTLTFLAGQASRTFPIPVLDDDLVDGPKTVGVQLSSPVGASLGTPSMAMVTITDNDVAGTVQFGAAQYVADEGGGTFNVPVMRTGGSAAGVTAAYTVTGGTAAPGVDFLLSSSLGTVTFGRGVTMMTIPVLPMNNTPLAGPRTLDLTLTAAGGGGTLGTVRRATITIEEVAFQLTPAVYTVAEGGTATVTVTRLGPVGRAVTVDWATEDGTATAGSDYVASAGTLTFGVGGRTRTLTVATLPDTVVEGAESVLLRLGAAGTGTALAPQRTAVIVITDNDAGGRIAFGAASHVVPENRGTYLVAVTRSGGAAGPVTVDYAVTGGTATGGGVDHAAAAGTLTFAAGQTSATIPMVVTDDTLVEANETVVLTLSNATGGATVGTPAATTLTIVDNDRTSTVQFSAAAYTVGEGAGSATLTLTRTGVTTVPVTVQVTTSDGTAAAGTDYTAVNTPVTFPAGVTSRTVPVPVLANGAVDGSRTVTVTLSGATAPAAVGTPGTAVLTILDDDSTLAFSATDYPVAEGGTATLTVRRTGSLLGTVTVDYAVTGGTPGGTDYAPVSGRLTFGPGVATRTLTVRTLVDALVEGPETVRVALSAPAGQATVGTPATATVTIADNPPVVTFGAPAYAVTEGTRSVTLSVVRSGPSTGTVTVKYAVVGGTAAGGADFNVILPGTLTFGPGVMSRTLTVGIVNDSGAELPETIVLGLSSPTGAVLGTPARTTLTIADNEPQVKFGAAAYTVSEGTARATLTVLRTGLTTVPVTVQYSRTGGTATAGSDYSVTTGTLRFGPGVTSRTITVGIVDDGVPEGPETVVFRLSNPSGATLGTPSTTTLTIVDNEPVVRFGAASYTVSEATPALAVTVLRTGPATVPVTVQYAVTGGTATAGQDYTVGGTGTLTFGVGVTSQTITVGVVNDTLTEGAETLVLTLSNPAGTTLGTPATATVTLTDNDVAGVVEFEGAVYSGVEGGGEALVTVIRRGGTAGAVTVQVATGDGSAVAGTHYVAVAGTLTFAAGQTSITFAVPLLDGGGASGRWLDVVLSQPGGGATLGPLTRAVVWAIDAQ